MVKEQAMMSRHRLLQPLVVMTFLMVPVIPGPVTPCRNVPGLGPSSWVVAVMGMNGQKIHVRGKGDRPRNERCCIRARQLTEP